MAKLYKTPFSTEIWIIWTCRKIVEIVTSYDLRTEILSELRTPTETPEARIYVLGAMRPYGALVKFQS